MLPPPVPEPSPEQAGAGSQGEAADELDALRARLAALEGRLKRS